MTPADWRFGRFELQTRERRLLLDGAPVALGARAFDMLVVMLERAGRLVTKSELLDLVWPGLVVEENNVAAQVVALRKVLGSEMIATVPGHGYRFVGQAEALGPVDRPASAAAAPAPAASAEPPGPPLFGREHDLQRLGAALGAPGLVSLVGPGGVGKTTLARFLVERIEAARDPAMPAGPPVWVDLAALTEGTQLVPALARALGQQVPQAEAVHALAKALGETTLLVLDNAEHLRAATAELLAGLMPQAPGLCVLVTSQVPLALSCEHVQPLEPLRVADDDTLPEQALRTDAIGLLVARACAADSRLRLGSAQLPLLRSLCAQLDGLPLALEMAAARVPLLGLQGVHEALAERFALLKRTRPVGDSRHQTLRAALAWSHSLLAPEEQALFRQLGVFAGGFTLELMLAVADGGAADRWTLIDRLATLVEHSLVVTLPGEADARPRYRLLETMQAFALEQLRASGEERAVRGRHARAVQAVLTQSLAAKDHLVGDAHGRLVAQALLEFDNARQAWRWACVNDPSCAVALSAAAAGLASTTPWRAEVFDWMSACEPLLDDAVPLPEQARWWTEFAHQMLVLRSKRSTAVARRACERALATGDEGLMAWSQMYLARSFLAPDPEAHQACETVQALLARHPEWPDRLRMHAAGTRALVAHYAQDFDQALLGFQDEQRIAERLQLRDAVEVAECNVIALLLLLGRLDEGVAATRVALRRMGSRHSVATAYLRINLIDALLTLGRVDEATREAAATWQLARRFDVVHAAGEMLAKLTLHQGRPRAAAQLHAHWLGVCEQHHTVPERDAGSAHVEAQIRQALAADPVGVGLMAPQVLDDESVERLLLGPDDPA